MSHHTSSQHYHHMEYVNQTASHAFAVSKQKVPSIADIHIKALLDSTPDIVYYFEEGIKETATNKIVNCILLSRYAVYPNTTSALTHEDSICFDDEFGYLEPVIIANDKYLIACFNFIHHDYVLFARFDQHEIKMELDFNNNKTLDLFNGIKFSHRNLKSFAFYGDQLFGVDVTSKNHLLHWDLADKQDNFVFRRIPLNVISDDLEIGDSMYPLRLEVHNGYLYLFQRFETRKAVEISKISYLNNKIQETGVGWLMEDGHENLFDDFDKIHGFMFDPEMKKYFMFSDCEMIIENDTRSNTADFYVDSDFKFKFGDDGNDWTSYYHTKVPLVTNTMDNKTFVFDEKVAFLDVEMDNDQWVLHLDFTHNFVYFPIQFKEYQDSIYFMELDHVNSRKQCVFVKFHPLSVGRDTLKVMSGNSILQVVSGKDILIQDIMDKANVDNETSLNSIMNNHKWT